MEIRAVDWNASDGARLRAAQEAEVSARYGVPDSEPGPKPNADSITVFFVAYDGAEPVGCGALRAIDDRHGEVKRMYVVPERRGSGVAVSILRALETDARTRGWERLVLETGVEQPDAVRFYEREGYTRIPNFGYYADSPISLCYEKRF
jgi:putative acetyltransferase